MQAPLARLPIVVAALAACLVVAGSRPAQALSVTPVSAVFNLDLGGGVLLKGSIDFVEMVTGTPTGGVVLDGSVAPTDITFVFTISSDPDADPSVSLFSTRAFRDLGAASPVFSAVGTIPGPGSDLTFPFVNEVNAYWSYDPVVAPGTTADPFFLSFSSVAVGDMFSFEEVILPLATFTVVPEPRLAGLLALGLGALSRRMAGWLRA